MFSRWPVIRIAIALVVVLTMGIAAPIHAAHHHGDNRLHSECTLCQLHSPACQTFAGPGAGISLEPVFTLALFSAPALHCACVAVTATRGPPSFLA